jgi:hypothetical protein
LATKKRKKRKNIDSFALLSNSHNFAKIFCGAAKRDFSILHPRSSIFFGCGFAALCLLCLFVATYLSSMLPSYRQGGR